MNGSAKPFYSKSANTNTPYSGQVGDRGAMIWDGMQMMMKSLNPNTSELQQLHEITLNMNEMLEQTRNLYNEAITSRDAAYQRFQGADNKLLQVNNIVQRYVNVKDPVVASDGYTYERTEITNYWQECQNTHSKAYSQQTREELDQVFLPNLSLSRLVELLKKIRAPDVHPPTTRGIIPPIPANRMNWAEDEVPIQRPMEAPQGNLAGSRANNSRRFDNPRFKGGHGKQATHPCLRVYGTCNFMDDCTFANYPYEACLNYIKGKCRFGDSCKELHVDRNDPRYQNSRSSANNNNEGNENINSSNHHGDAEEHAAGKGKKSNSKEKTAESNASETARGADGGNDE
ncbi:RNA binding protein [Angomonas deanei]|uniref:C3H1-type domain-containing protein n=1 Tax=Angomonas deanei TaxID=59799 RepID=A0A7G2CCF4_9TRYP|nr:RNA binding protein [Angomonas deanei]CAD2217498.1 hypothetical protein, conserved [Angomonas deanei]|eukprot:EPY38064.1 RNA binding protein [Angomonas deanei]